jgi:ketosteroid isomerase-like protein
MIEQGADQTAILEMRQKHLDASLGHDIDTLVETFTEDGVEMPPGGPAVIGREAYRPLRIDARAYWGFFLEL